MRKGLFLVLIFAGLTGCLKKQDFPNRPDLTYVGIIPAVQPADSLGVIRLEFTDGDGDLGLDDSDSDSPFAEGDPYYFNLFARYFDKRDGAWVEFVPPEPLFNARFKRLSSAGSDAIEGLIDYGFAARPGAPFDTIRYEIYIVDRSLQHSDTIVTPEIVLSTFQ